MSDDRDHLEMASPVNPYMTQGGLEYGAPEGTEAYAGAPLPAGTPPAGEDAVTAALREVYDPEIPVNIYDLGLIYEMNIKPTGDVLVLMTLTAPACPVAGEMPGEVANRVATVEGVGEVTVRLTWDPPWTMERLSEDAKLALDLY